MKPFKKKRDTTSYKQQHGTFECIMCERRFVSEHDLNGHVVDRHFHFHSSGSATTPPWIGDNNICICWCGQTMHRTYILPHFSNHGGVFVHMAECMLNPPKVHK